MQRLLVIAILIFLTSFATADVASIGEYSVITGAENNSVTKGQNNVDSLIKRFYLKRSNKWPDGTKVKVLLPSKDSDTYAAFMIQALNMSEREFDSYWIKEMQKNGATQPRSIGSASAFRLIKRYPYTIAIVPTSEVPDDGSINVIFTF